jgi:hypothetical protein
MRANGSNRAAMVMVVAFSPKGPPAFEAMPEWPREAKPFAQHATAGLHRTATTPRFSRTPVLLTGETRRFGGGVLMNLSAFLTKTVI